VAVNAPSLYTSHALGALRDRISWSITMYEILYNLSNSSSQLQMTQHLQVVNLLSASRLMSLPRVDQRVHKKRDTFIQ
jgi:hypothetical protein